MRADHPRVINFINRATLRTVRVFRIRTEYFIPDPGRAGQLEGNPPY